MNVDVAPEIKNKIENDKQFDTVLEIRLKQDNSVSWKIPTDIKTAVYLLKILSIAVNDMLRLTLKPKESKVWSPFRKRGGGNGG